MQDLQTRLGTFCLSLTQAPGTIESEVERRQALLLASLNIVIGLFVIVANIIIAYTDSQYLKTTFPIVGPAFIILIISYLLSRTGHHKIGAVLLIFAFSAAAIFSGSLNPTYQTMGPISVSFSIILAAIFIPVRGVIIISLINWIGLIFALFFLPGELAGDEALVIILWVAVITVIIILWLVYRNSIERIRQAERIQFEVYKEKAAFMQHVIQSLSHDLKTPLAIINTSLYLLAKLNDPDKQHKKIETIQRQTRQVEQLIQDILSVSRLDTLPHSDFNRVDVNELISGLQIDLHPLIENKNLSLQIHLDCELPPALGNREELQRAISNLIENAIHYTEDGGTITVTTGFKSKQEMEILVQDTGIGISAEDLPHIFDHFYRADKTRDTYTGGTGLGLSIVKKIIERHRGNVSVESNPGQGSTFCICLPITQNLVHSAN